MGMPIATASRSCSNRSSTWGTSPLTCSRCPRRSARSLPISSSCSGITRAIIHGTATRDRHLALIRQHLGWRFPTGQDKQALEIWLRIHGAPEAPTEADLCECTYARLQRLGIELPAEQELQRIVRAALHGFFHEVHQRVAAQLSETVRTSLDQLLVVGSDDAQSAFDQLKAEPSAPGVQHLQQELTKLQTLRAIGVPAEALAEVPFKVLQLLKRRAYQEDASQMRAHPASIRYALLACFIHGRTMDVTDDAVRMMLEIIRRIETQTEKHLHQGTLAGYQTGGGQGAAALSGR